MRRALFGISVALALCGVATAEPLVIEWDANPAAENVTAYTVGWGPSSRGEGYTYPNVADETATLHSLGEQTALVCAAVQAVNALGARSGWSRELCYDPTREPGIRSWVSIPGAPVGIELSKLMAWLQGGRIVVTETGVFVEWAGRQRIQVPASVLGP